MLKKLKLTDYIIIAVIVILVVIGSLAVFKKKNFSNLPIEKETKINFEVFNSVYIFFVSLTLHQ